MQSLLRSSDCSWVRLSVITVIAFSTLSCGSEGVDSSNDDNVVEDSLILPDEGAGVDTSQEEPDLPVPPEEDVVECGEAPCVLWETTCEDEFGYRMCTLDESGCTVFGPPVFCSPGATCVSGECLGECSIPRMVVIADGTANLANRWDWMEPGLAMGLTDAWPGSEFAWIQLPGRCGCAASSN